MSDTISGVHTAYSAATPTILQCGNEQDIPIDRIVVPPTSKRSIDPDTVAGLMHSIREIGLLNPIVVTQDFVLVAGRHRLAAARKLGWKTIGAKIVATDALKNELIAIDENLIRKELNILEQSDLLQRREEIFLALGKRAQPGQNQFTASTSAGQYTSGDISRGGGAYHAPALSVTGKITTKDLAREMGLAERTVQERLKIAREISHDVKDRIRDTPIADNKSDLLRLMKVKDKDDQMEVVGRILSGGVKTIKEAVSIVSREKQRDEFAKLATEVQKLPDTIDLRCGDFFLCESDEIEDESIDAVVSDFPWINSWKENIAPFLSIVNRILRKGGVAILYCGHARLYEVFSGLHECEIGFGEDDALTYSWICALTNEGTHPAVHHKGVMCGWKPILILQRPPLHPPHSMYHDLQKGSGREKKFHDWQQGCQEIKPLISSWTVPGSIILDPFMGSGTIGVAAKQLGRRFIGYDIDTKNVQIAKARILEMENGERKRKE